MRTLVISDLHLGAPRGMDLLRSRPETLEALVAGLAGVGRLVLLGDTLELRHGPPRDALAAAQPVLRAVGKALGRDAEVVLLAGNHDHRVAAPWLEARLDAGAPPLGVAERTSPEATPLAGALADALGGPAVHLDYPGTWLADGVWATHGHYLDRHVTVPSFERVGLGAVARVSRSREAALDGADAYEAAVAPLYAFVDALAARRADHASNPSARMWHALNGSDPVRALLLAGGLRAGVGALNLAGLGPLRADLSGPALRRSALRAMGEVVTRLGVEARHVVFGHTHRAGPGPADDLAEWTLAGGTRLLNTGCWVRDPLFGGTADPDSPYRAGAAVLVEDGAAPRAVRLLP